MEFKELYDISYSKIQVNRRYMNARRIVYKECPNSKAYESNIDDCSICPYFQVKEFKVIDGVYGECEISDNKFPWDLEDTYFLGLGIPCNCPLPLTKMLWSFGVNHEYFSWYFNSDAVLLIHSNPYYYCNINNDKREEFIEHYKYGSKSNLINLLNEVKYRVKIVKVKE